MIAEPECLSCILSKQKIRCRNKDKNLSSAYLSEVSGILFNYGNSESSPQLNERIDRLYEQYFDIEDLSSLKKKYNDLLLAKSDEICQNIQSAQDPIAEAVKYACVGNYIDFHSVDGVAEEKLGNLLENANNQTLDDIEINEFKRDLAKANKLIYLTDNCGEIVIDKILADILKQHYPSLDITVIVRGKPIYNDVTMEDAEQVGFTASYRCIGNGSGMAGIVPELLTGDLKTLFDNADIIISKGQGNSDSMFGSNLNTYYMFLCKCELFMKRFGADRFTPIFAHEKRLTF